MSGPSLEDTQMRVEEFRDERDWSEEALVNHHPIANKHGGKGLGGSAGAGSE